MLAQSADKKNQSCLHELKAMENKNTNIPIALAQIVLQSKVRVYLSMKGIEYGSYS